MDDIFDATYVINMDKDVRRLDEFKEMMDSSSWKFTRYAASDGKKLSPEEWKEYVKRDAWLSENEVGCLVSHVSLWKDILENTTHERVAIFEDDARTHVEGSTVKKLLKDLYSHLEEKGRREPDLLYLGKALDDCMKYVRVHGNVFESVHPLCLHAYVITRRGIKKLLSHLPFSQAIDLVPIRLRKKAKLSLFAFHPSLYFQDIFGNASNSRSLASGMNATTECLVSHQHVPTDTMSYVCVLLVGIVAAILLFLLQSLSTSWME